MTVDDADFSSAGMAQQRLADLLQFLGQQGLSQTQVAARVGLPPQYLSDIKRGQRPMTELVARRLGEEFGVNFRWLLGTSDTMQQPQSPSAALPASSSLWLPLFSHPVEGEPRADARWDGTGVEIAGAAAAKLVLAKLPYVLRFGHNDTEGRLRRGDLILISQTPDDRAEISVVRQRGKSFLARRNKDGDWQRVANGKLLPADCPVSGHCLGIIWSSLL